MTRKQAQAGWNELMAVYAESEAQADTRRAAIYSADLIAHNWSRLSNMERNALSRKKPGTHTTPFTMSSDLSTKSAAIDHALTEFHSYKELSAMLGFPENYIRRHVNHLLANFSGTCKQVAEGRKIKFISL